MENKTEDKIMKTASVTFKTTPKIKELLEKVSKKEFRTVSMQVEKIVVEYFDKEGIDWREEESD